MTSLIYKKILRCGNNVTAPDLYCSFVTSVLFDHKHLCAICIQSYDDV